MQHGKLHAIRHRNKIHHKPPHCNNFVDNFFPLLLLVKQIPQHCVTLILGLRNFNDATHIINITQRNIKPSYTNFNLQFMVSLL